MASTLRKNVSGTVSAKPVGCCVQIVPDTICFPEGARPGRGHVSGAAPRSRGGTGGGNPKGLALRAGGEVAPSAWRRTGSGSLPFFSTQILSRKPIRQGEFMAHSSLMKQRRVATKVLFVAITTFSGALAKTAPARQVTPTYANELRRAGIPGD